MSESPEAATESGGLELRGGFFLLDNVLDLAVPSPSAIVPGLQIARADEEKVNRIRAALKEVGSQMAMLNRTTWYEYDRLPANPRGYTWQPLTRERWRYSVLEFDSAARSQPQCHLALRAMYLEQLPLSSILEFNTGEPYGRGSVTSMGWQHDVSGAGGIMPTTVSTVDNAALNRWRGAIQALDTLDTRKHEGIHRAVEFFERFGKVRMPFGLEMLGLFMVIEMLLTHAPGDREVGDSLSHQLSAKIPLLAERMLEPIDYNMFGLKVSHDQLWKRLYRCRSAIAHGGHADFTKGQFGVLRDYPTAVWFLREATRKLLRLALDEPSLVAALRKV